MDIPVYNPKTYEYCPTAKPANRNVSDINSTCWEPVNLWIKHSHWLMVVWGLSCWGCVMMSRTTLSNFLGRAFLKSSNCFCSSSYFWDVIYVYHCEPGFNVVGPEDRKMQGRHALVVVATHVKSPMLHVLNFHCSIHSKQLTLSITALRPTNPISLKWQLKMSLSGIKAKLHLFSTGSFYLIYNIGITKYGLIRLIIGFYS